MDSSSFGISLFSSLATALIGGGYLWYDKRGKDKAIKNLSDQVKVISDKQIEHSTKFVTETRTREILKEEIEDIKVSIADVKAHVSTISNNVSTLVGDLRVMSAVQDVLKQGNT